MDSTAHATRRIPRNRRAARARSRSISLVSVSLLAALMMGSWRTQATPAVVPMLGAHTLVTQPDKIGHSPAVSQALTTQASGSSLLVLNAGFVDNDAPPVDSYGNTWKRVGRTSYRGYEGRFDVKAYVVAQARGGASHTISLAKPGHPQGEITAPFIEIRDAGVLADMAQNYPAPSTVERAVAKLARVANRLADNTHSTGSNASMTSGKVTTTGPATLIAVWLGEAQVYKMTAVPDSGFKVIDQFLDLPPSSGVQCAVAVRNVDKAGSYDVTWTGAPTQGAMLWLFAFQRAPRATGS